MVAAVRIFQCFSFLAVLSIHIVSAAEQPALPLAAERKDFSAVETLIQQSADVNAAQVDGMTALHWLALYDAVDTADKLIKAGADVAAKNRYGVTPLSLACQNGSEEMVRLLLNAGADANTSLDGGETALMTAARTGKLGPVELLLSAGADVSATEHKGQTALIWAAAEGNTAVVDALIRSGADVNVELRSGFNAFFFAVRQGKIPTVLRLIEAGCDVNHIMQTQQGLRFNSGKTKLTPSLMAVENGHFELACSLLDLGADPNAMPSGYSALHAITWVRKPIRGDGDPSPQGSGKYNSLDMTKKLVSAGANINAKLQHGKSGRGRFNYTGATPFLLAAQTADLELMKLLVELGADTNILTADQCSPLLAATGVGALGDGDESAGTEEEMIAAVEYLLELGADINWVDDNGETVMHGAAYQSCAKLVQVLADHGAKIETWNRENRAGWTPYVIAAGYRPGNFRPSPETMASIGDVMRSESVELPKIDKDAKNRRRWPDNN